MLNRATLKENGMRAFKANYWICVAVALVLAFLSGGSSGGGSSFRNTIKNNSSSSSDQDEVNSILNNLINPNGDNHGDEPGMTAAQQGMFAAIGIAAVIGMLIALAISIAFSAFVSYPLIVGGKRFFTVNSFKAANFGELGFAFKKGRYMNIVKVMFMKNLFIFLWSLLFVIPGIIKLYEYFLVDYILTEDPTIDYKTALNQSKEMMNGYKMETFILELSFIGWILLSILTCGILSIFYVNPYIHATMAELFLELRNKHFGSSVQPYFTPNFAGAGAAGFNNGGYNAGSYNPRTDNNGPAYYTPDQGSYGQTPTNTNNDYYGQNTDQTQYYNQSSDYNSGVTTNYNDPNNNNPYNGL